MENIAKRSYHPLVMYFYCNNLLNSKQLALIPTSTLAYWDKNELELMFGFDWVKMFSTDLEYITKTQKHKIIYKAQKLCIKTLACFSSIFDKMENIQSMMKKNAKQVIDTIDYLSTEMPIKTACRIFKISSNQYYRWKNKIYCSASVLNLCFKTHPHQLTIAECSAIKEAINDPEYRNFPKASIYYTLLNRGLLFCSITTFYKYARLLFNGDKKIKEENPKVQLFATRPFEYLHLDTTLMPTSKGGLRRVVFITDHFSKALLHKIIVPDSKSTWVADALKETFKKHKLINYPKAINIISDKGSENKGEVLKWIDEFITPNMVIKKTVGENGFKFYNNEVESCFHFFKNVFSKNRTYVDDDSLNIGLEEYEIFINNQWYPKDFYGITPNQILMGDTPDKNKFKEAIKNQKISRHLKNKSAKFCDVCS